MQDIFLSEFISLYSCDSCYSWSTFFRFATDKKMIPATGWPGSFRWIRLFFRIPRGELFVLRRSDIFRGAGAGLCGFAVLALDRVVDFLTMNRNRLRCFDSKPHFVTTDVHDCHHNIVADHDAFVSVSGKDQHVVLKVIEVERVRIAKQTCPLWECLIGASTIPFLARPMIGRLQR